MMFPPKGTPWYPIHDALSYHLLSVPKWRVERDRLIYQSLQELHKNNVFVDHFHAMQDKLRPSLMADPNKVGAITSNPYDVFPYSSVHAAISSDHLLEKTSAYWTETLTHFPINDLQATRNDSVLTASWTGPSAIRLELGSDSLSPPSVATDSRTLPVVSHEGRWTCLLVPGVVQRGAEKADQFSDRTYYQVLPAKFRVRISGYRGSFQLINAVTDEPIQTK